MHRSYVNIFITELKMKDCVCTHVQIKVTDLRLFCF